MAHFYGTLEGNRGKATRCGTKIGGLSVTAAGWGGAIYVKLFEQDGVDHYTVSIGPWQGSGGSYVKLASGKLDATLSIDREDTCTACGRISIDCSRDPCDAVIADRQA